MQHRGAKTVLNADVGILGITKGMVLLPNCVQVQQ